MRAAVSLLAALTLLTGCGGSDVGAEPASSAEVLKPGAVVYWQTVSDPDSEQWDRGEELLEKFPDGDRLIAWLKQELSDQDLTWEEDIRPALGSVVDVVVYPGPLHIPTVVGLTNSENKQKLVELAAKLDGRGDEPLATRTVGDWVAVSTSQSEIDRVLKEPGEEALADDATFKSAMEELPDDALSRIYVDPARALDIVSPAVERMLGLENLDFAGAWAKAREDGAELELTLRGEGADRVLSTGEPYTSKLLEFVPDDALAFISFRGEGLESRLEQLMNHSFAAMALRELEREVGVDVAELAALLDGEVAFFIRPGVPTAEFTLLLDSEDPQNAKESIEPLLRFVPERFRITVETLEDVVVVSTSLNPLADLERPGDKLGDSDRFTEALDAAGAPDQYTGLVYVDLREAAALVGALLDSPGIRRNLEPLRTFVAYGTSEVDAASVRVFLEID